MNFIRILFARLSIDIFLFLSEKSSTKQFPDISHNLSNWSRLKSTFLSSIWEYLNLLLSRRIEIKFIMQIRRRQTFALHIMIKQKVNYKNFLVTQSFCSTDDNDKIK